MQGQTDTACRRRPRPPCRALDALIVGGREVWLVVGRDRAEIAALLRSEGDLTLCRSVRPDGVVVLGRASADGDPLLSRFLRESELARV